MALTEQQKQTLLMRSKGLRECITHELSPLHVTVDQARVTARYNRWCQAACRGDRAAFEQLLERRNINPAGLTQLLDATAQRANSAAAFDWTASVEAVLYEAEHTDAALETFEVPSTTPFADFYTPFCIAAHKQLMSALPPNAYKLSDAIHRTLVRGLVNSLQFVFQSALALEFKIDQIKHPGVLSNDIPFAQKNFSKTLRQPTQLTHFLLEYSVAARAAAALMDRWQHNTVEWIQRLTADTPAIALRFMGDAPLGEVVDIESGLSDPHNGGKSVLRLHFASGLRLIYKPRSVALDLAYNDFLDWLEQHGAPYPLRKPVYLERAGYAWIEHIDHVPCGSPEELLQFCGAAGALLCLSYLLDATDLHDGNLIATPTSPVLIDLETLLQPRLAAPSSSIKQDALRKATLLAHQSVLRTGMLPSLKTGADGAVADMGYLGGLLGHCSAEWYRHEATASPLSEAMHSALTSGALDPTVFIDQVIQGFTDTYTFLHRQRQALLSDTGPLQRFNHQPVRFLLRDTTLYLKLLESSFSAQALRTGMDRSLVLESLYRLALHRPDSSAIEAAVEMEIAALEAWDIPLIHATTDSTGLPLPSGGFVPYLFEQPSHEAMVQRLCNFNAEDLARQLEFVHGSFAARTVSMSIGSPRAWGDVALSTPQDVHPVQGGMAVDAIASEIRRRAIVGEDGSATWMAPVPLLGSHRFRFDMVPLNREFGIMGIAFFLAAHSRTTGNQASETLAKQAIQTVVQRLGIAHSDVSAIPHPPASIPVAGMGAVLYAMQRSSVFLHDPEIEAAAHRLAHRLPTLTSTPWTAPQDMADGSELCLGLITLTEAELAVAWGQRLLAHWGHLDGTQRQTVVLHAPYLALCWHRLYQTTHVEAFHQAHHETLGLMHKATQDNATQDTPLYFSLLACTDGGADSVLGTWLSEQLKHLCQADLPSSDHLQSGASAVAEKLNTASHTLNRPPLRDAAQRIIGDMVRRATTMRGYQTIEGMPLGAFFPSFSQGLSGIGYALLRNQAGTSLPCVQLWD